MQSINLDVFGRLVLAVRSASGWNVYYIGDEGKRRPAPDIAIPADISVAELETYLGDLCHEWCTPGHPVVKRLQKARQ